MNSDEFNNFKSLFVKIVIDMKVGEDVDFSNHKFKKDIRSLVIDIIRTECSLPFGWTLELKSDNSYNFRKVSISKQLFNKIKNENPTIKDHYTELDYILGSLFEYSDKLPF